MWVQPQQARVGLWCGATPCCCAGPPGQWQQQQAAELEVESRHEHAVAAEERRSRSASRPTAHTRPSLPWGLSGGVIPGLRASHLPMSRLPGPAPLGRWDRAGAPYDRWGRTHASNSCAVTPSLQVSALTSLRKLDLRNNTGLARANVAAWHPLLGLRSLGEVKLWLCGIRAVPAALAPLRAAGVNIKIGYATEQEMYDDM